MRFLAILLAFCTASIALSNHHENAETSKSPFSKSALIKIAMSAAPTSISSNATIMDYDGTVLRQGDTQWMCMTGTDAQRINPGCMDLEWQKWNQRFMSGEGNDLKNQKFGQAYMLQGDVPVDNDVPLSVMQNDHEKSNENGNWHDSGPHLMLLLPGDVLKQITSNPYAGGSYVMFPGTEWEHLMIPIGNVIPSFKD